MALFIFLCSILGTGKLRSALKTILGLGVLFYAIFFADVLSLNRLYILICLMQLLFDLIETRKINTNYFLNLFLLSFMSLYTAIVVPLVSLFFYVIRNANSELKNFEKHVFTFSLLVTSVFFMFNLPTLNITDSFLLSDRYGITVLIYSVFLVITLDLFLKKESLSLRMPFVTLGFAVYAFEILSQMSSRLSLNTLILVKVSFCIVLLATLFGHVSRFFMDGNLRKLSFALNIHYIFMLRGFNYLRLEVALVFILILFLISYIPAKLKLRFSIGYPVLFLFILNRVIFIGEHEPMAYLSLIYFFFFGYVYLNSAKDSLLRRRGV